MLSLLKNAGGELAQHGEILEILAREAASPSGSKGAPRSLSPPA